MQTTALVKGKNCIQFRNWTVEDGPVQWRNIDPWTDIDAELKQNDLERAASTLRRYLEFMSREFCHSLRADVVFRGDNQHSLGDLMPRATSRFGDLLKEAVSAAKKWENEELSSEIQSVLDNFRKCVQATQVENWAVNAKVHYNEWAKLHEKDFRPVANAFKELIESMGCSKCGSILYVTPEFGPKESLRCSCSARNYNLNKKVK